MPVRPYRWSSSASIHVAVLAFVLTGFACVLIAGCGSDEEARRKAEQAEDLRLRTQGMQDPGVSDRFDNEGLKVDAFDLSGDNVADLWKLYRVEKKVDDPEPTLKLVRKEVDTNFDGEVDLWFLYNEQEALYREDADTNFDGNIDLIEYYEDGRIVKREVFKGGGETPTAVKHYRGGRLVRIERDDDKNGNVDRWEIYAAGQLVQIGRDTDGDGKVDFWNDFQ